MNRINFARMTDENARIFCFQCKKPMENGTELSFGGGLHCEDCVRSYVVRINRELKLTPEQLEEDVLREFRERRVLGASLARDIRRKVGNSMYAEPRRCGVCGSLRHRSEDCAHEEVRE